MTAKLVRALALLLPLTLDRSARAGEVLSVVAELPVIGRPDSLRFLRLGRGSALSLVGVTSTNVQTWRVGKVSEPTVSPRAGSLHAFADLDDDGLLDLALCRGAASGLPARIVILQGDGTGHFEERLSIPFDGEGRGLAVADADDDGRDDLVLGVVSPSGESSALRTYRRIGAFAFDAPRETSLLLPGTVGTGVYAVGWITSSDLDGDGLADVIVRSPIGSLSVWLGAGDGTFVPHETSLAASSGPVILADLDGDRRPELVYTSAGRFHPPWIAVYHNDGEARFTLVTLAATPWAYGPFAVADADRDGIPDVLRADASRITVFPGDGHGGFRPEVQRALPGYGPLADSDVVVPVDWDSDSRLDFVFLTGRGLVVLGPETPRVDRLAVPVLLSTTGSYGTRFDSDLLLTNTGDTPVHAELRYEAAAGGGSGVVMRDIGPGAQLLAPSALGFLREEGLPIPADGPLVGTLRVSASGAALPSALRATVRTTSPGGAGVSYGGVPSLDALRAESFVPWLVESARDRTNLAFVNAGSADDGPVTLRVTVASGDPSAPGEAVLPDVTLSPGRFFQYGHALDAAGLASRLGWARISRVAGNAPYLAWGTVNDAATGDGSFVPAVAAGSAVAACQTLPAVVQTERYATELVVTNPGDAAVSVRATLVATGTLLEETLAPRQVLYLADLFAELRRRGLAGAPAAGTAIASPLSVCSSGFPRLLAGARVSTAAPGGRHFGLYEPAVPQDADHATSVVVPDLRQDASIRTNLAIVNIGPATSFRVEIHDGTTGQIVASREGVALASGEHLQLSSVLRDLAPSTNRGWARVVAPDRYEFLAYGVVMDGAEPGLGTDDGSFVLGLPE